MFDRPILQVMETLLHSKINKYALFQACFVDKMSTSVNKSGGKVFA